MIKQKFAIFLLVLIMGLSLANVVSADLVTCGGPNETPCTIRDLIFTIERIINFLLAWAWLVSFLFIVWAAWTMVGASGDQEEITKGKETLKTAIIGFFLIMAVYLLINFVVAFITGKTEDGAFNIFRDLLFR